MSVLAEIDQTLTELSEQATDLRRLVTVWHAESKHCYAQAEAADDTFDDQWAAMGNIYEHCADRLERVLNGGRVSSE